MIIKCILPNQTDFSFIGTKRVTYQVVSGVTVHVHDINSKGSALINLLGNLNFLTIGILKKACKQGQHFSVQQRMVGNNFVKQGKMDWTYVTEKIWIE